MIQNISKLFNLNNKYKTEEHTIPDNLRNSYYSYLSEYKYGIPITKII